MGALFLVSILSLAGVGVAYAGFTDEIHIYGTIETGTVEIDWIGWYSGTYVYKVWGLQEPTPLGKPDYYNLEEEILIYRGFLNDIPTEAEVLQWAADNHGFAELVAFAEAGDGAYTFPDGTESDVDMEFDNLFPCIDFCADFIFHYGGSIPARINLAEMFPVLYDINYPDTEELGALVDIYNAAPGEGFGAWVEAYRMYPIIEPETGRITGWDQGEAIYPLYQLHECYYVMVKLCIHLPQDNYWQGMSGAFGANIGVIQWNDQCEDNINANG